jgi:hypothetical protein
VDLREHLDVVVLLQAAEIQRLTNSLHDYRLK